MQSYQNSAQREHKDLRYAQRAQHNQLLKNMLGYIEEQLVSPWRAIRAITEHPQLSDAEKIAHIRALLAQHDEQRLASLRNEVATELSDNDYFSILEARSVRIQNRISPILKVLTFQGEAGAALLDALQYCQAKDGAVDKQAPLAFLSSEERGAVTEHGRFRVSLYKAFLFLHTQRTIKAGTLNLAHSYQYRPLDEYLIDRERWRRDKTRRECDRSQWKITPAGYIEDEVIVAQWDEILRLITTLKLKEVTASERRAVKTSIRRM